MVTIGCSFTIAVVVLNVVIHSSYVETNGAETSRCLKECLKSILKFEHSFTFQFRNFEKICDKLESAALCSQKCSPADQHRFYHHTTFYRLHCVDFYEELENQFDCLKKASPHVDKTCNAQCTFNNDKTDNNDDQIKIYCRTLECSLICYYKTFASACPKTRETLLNLSTRQINNMLLFITPDSLLNAESECRQLHDENQMKQKMLET
ncbi:Chondroitin proteoglycan 4 family protein [Acanthocheilonema viteae]